MLVIMYITMACCHIWNSPFPLFQTPACRSHRVLPDSLSVNWLNWLPRPPLCDREKQGVGCFPAEVVSRITNMWLLRQYLVFKINFIEPFYHQGVLLLMSRMVDSKCIPRERRGRCVTLSNETSVISFLLVSVSQGDADSIAQVSTQK